MKLGTLTWRRYLICGFLFPFFHTSSAADPGEVDCRNIKKEIASFTEENILSLADANEDSPKIEPSTVAQLKNLREQVHTCYLSSPADSATEWDAGDFLRLEAQLAFFEITMGQAAADENTDVTWILINSPKFGQAVIDLQKALGIE